MKKSLLALAALATVAGAASAQSSVTLSGSVDLGLKRTPSGPGGDQGWSMGNAASGRTAITFAGREDLGNGMYAFFLANHRFQAQNGNTTDTAPRFWRQSWVGLGGGFGDVRLGRMLVPLQDFNGQYEAWDGGDTVGTVHTGGLLAGSRTNSTVYYRSPSFGGLQVHASVAETQDNGGTERPMGVGVQYKGGPISAAVAWDRNSVDFTTMGVYGSYDFKVVKVMAQFERGEINADGDKNRKASISVLAPVGAAVLKAGFGKFGGTDTKKFGVGVDYNLSKRTYLYSDIGKTSGDGATDDGAYAIDSPNRNSKVAFDIGIRHKF